MLPDPGRRDDRMLVLKEMVSAEGIESALQVER
jgi:hypothetical protein